jgi:murein DD-endopeptidase MepM/ murein hydrolase activator NlpD
MKGKGVLRWVLVVYLLAIHVALAYFLYKQIVMTTDLSSIGEIRDPTLSTPVPTPPDIPVPIDFPVDSPPQGPMVETSTTPPLSSRQLIIPVAGVRSDQLVDTFTAARGAGRSHDAIDIMAPAATPVLAAVTGRIAKFFDSVAGGITIYQIGEEGRFMYYYAHLQRRADGIKEGDLVTQGTTIGYVGDTGNAGPGNYHLHFSIARVVDPKRFWEGTYLNPYPYLKAGTVPDE